MSEERDFNRELNKRRKIINIIRSNYNDIEASSNELPIQSGSLPDAGNSPQPFPHTEEKADNYHL